MVLIAVLLLTLVGVGVALGFGGGAGSGSGIDPRLQRWVDRHTGGRLETIHFFSAALHRRADYLVYLPRGATRARPLPVFYLLHGMPGLPVAFVANAQIELRLQRLIAAGTASPMILVFPDGRIDGRADSDSEWANTPTGDYESDVLDVVADVDHRFGALACRQERAIAGISAGAFGATNIGLHHLSTFGLIQSWSGYYTETHNGVFAHASPATMRDNSPVEYVTSLASELRRQPLRMYLYGGRDDDLTRQLPGMVRVLRRLPVHLGWAIVPGGHSWRTWDPHVDAMLRMASADFTHPLDGASPTCTARRAS